MLQGCFKQCHTVCYNCVLRSVISGATRVFEGVSYGMLQKCSKECNKVCYNCVLRSVIRSVTIMC